MHLIYSLPTRDLAYSVTTGTLVSDITALNDPNPGERVRVLAAAGNVACAIQFGYAAKAPAAVALRGLRGIPPGWTVRLWTRIGLSWVEALATRTMRLPDGDIGATLVISSGQPGSSWQLTLHDDAPSNPAPQELEIGSVLIGNGVQTDIERGWSLASSAPGAMHRTTGNQVYGVRRPGYRILRCTPDYTDAAGARGNGLSTTNWQDVAAALRADPYVLAIARTGTQADIQTTSIYGIVTRIPATTHAAGPYYQPGELEIEEIPG